MTLPRQVLATLLLLATTIACAQVGHSRITVGTMELVLTYPSPAPVRPLSLGPFTLQVAPDAPVAPGPHRLVVMSHGTGGSPLADQALAQAFARAGIVAAQPLHAGDNFRDTRDAGPESFRRRPGEVLAVVDALASHPDWAPHLKLDKVGVHGMSAGGTSVLGLAGAQWRMLGLVRHCNRVGAADEGFCFNGAKDGAARAERKARYDRARYWPDFVLPAELMALHGGRDADDPRPDARIAAATLAVPVAAIYSPESLARIRIPVGLVSARDDQVLVPAFHSDHVLAHCKACERLADLPGGHFDLLWPWPEPVAREVAALQVRGGAPTPGFDGRLRDAAQQRIVEFHRRHLGP